MSPEILCYTALILIVMREIRDCNKINVRLSGVKNSTKFSLRVGRPSNKKI